MCRNFKLIDTVTMLSKLTVTCNSIHASEDKYAVIVEDGLYVLQLSGLPENVLPIMAFKKLFIEAPQYSISSKLGVRTNSFLIDLNQFDLYELILRMELSEELPQTPVNRQEIVKVEWSPRGLIGNQNNALAFLTNMGGLHLYVHTINEVEIEEYKSIENVSERIVLYFAQESGWENIEKQSPSIQLDELRKRAVHVTPTCFTWSHLLKDEVGSFSLLMVGHLDGGITFWRVDYRGANDTSNADVTLLTYCKSDLERVTSLFWQAADHNKGLLLLGDLEGRIKAFSVTEVERTKLTISDGTELWSQRDNVKIDLFRVLIHKEQIFLLAVKAGYILIFLLKENGNLLDTQRFHAGNYQVTGLELYEENIFIISTQTGTVKELKLTSNLEKIEMFSRPLYIDFKWVRFRVQGFIISRNRIFFGFLIGTKRLRDTRKTKEPSKLLIFSNNIKNPLEILMRNMKNSLSSYRDCLEVLRLNCLQEKKLPCDGLPADLDYDKLTITQLKTCLWLSKASEMMYDKMYFIKKYKVLRHDEFKYILKIKLSMDYIHRTLEKIIENKPITTFEKQSLDIHVMYLKETIAEDIIPKLGLGKHTIKQLCEILSAANKITYPEPIDCFWCKESLSCVPSHIDTRCNTTFMPITEMPYYKCPFCACIFHKSLDVLCEHLLCCYCDVALVMVDRVKDPKNLGVSLRSEEKKAGIDEVRRRM